MLGACPFAHEGCPAKERYGECFSDLHHDQYPATDYRTPLEKEWRGIEMETSQVCRAIHDAIHTSGYVPPKPERRVMLQELNSDRPSLRAMTERNYQQMLGRKILHWEEAS